MNLENSSANATRAALDDARSIIICAVFSLVSFPFAQNIRADVIADVSTNSSVTLGTGSSLDILFGTWTYAANNPGYPAAPFNIQILASAVAPNAPLVAIPGGQYYAGYIFSACLESIAGGISVPLIDAGAAVLGIPAGSLLLRPGAYVDGAAFDQIAVLTGSAGLTQVKAGALFGSAATEPWTPDAALVITDNGAPITLAAIGSAPSLLASFAEMLSGAGPVETGGINFRVLLDQPGSSTISSVPEPGSASLLFAAVCLAGSATARYRSRNS